MCGREGHGRKGKERAREKKAEAEAVVVVDGTSQTRAEGHRLTLTGGCILGESVQSTPERARGQPGVQCVSRWSTSNVEFGEHDPQPIDTARDDTAGGGGGHWYAPPPRGNSGGLGYSTGESCSIRSNKGCWRNKVGTGGELFGEPLSTMTGPACLQGKRSLVAHCGH